MTSNNISEKDILSYLVSTFQYWGITYVNQQTLKMARKDKPDTIKNMKLLLLHLAFLHMFDFQIKISDYFGAKNVIKQSEMQEIILAYLSECECPYLLQLENQDSKYVGCNFQSSRSLLLICGWIMAISDYFNQILAKLIRKKQQMIQNPPKKLPKYMQNLYKTGQMSGQISQSNQSQKIIQLYKSIRARQYNVECLKQKKQKILKRIQTQLKKINEKLSVYDLFSSKQTEDQTVFRQKQLKKILLNQIQNMKQRKYFWMWLDQKILKETQIQVKKNNQQYQKLQLKSKKDNYQIKVDLNYLSEYMELYSYYCQKYQQLSKQLDQMKLVVKKSKEIYSQITHQFSQTLQQGHKDIKLSKNKKYLFIASQLKQYLNIKIGQKLIQNYTNQQKIQQNSNIQYKETKKRLRKQLKKYLNQIQAAVKFI